MSEDKSLVTAITGHLADPTLPPHEKELILRHMMGSTESLARIRVGPFPEAFLDEADHMRKDKAFRKRILEDADFLYARADELRRKHTVNDCKDEKKPHIFLFSVEDGMSALLFGSKPQPCSAFNFEGLTWCTFGNAKTLYKVSISKGLAVVVHNLKEKLPARAVWVTSTGQLRNKSFAEHKEALAHIQKLADRGRLYPQPMPLPRRKHVEAPEPKDCCICGQNTLEINTIQVPNTRFAYDVCKECCAKPGTLEVVPLVCYGGRPECTNIFWFYKMFQDTDTHFTCPECVAEQGMPKPEPRICAKCQVNKVDDMRHYVCDPCVEQALKNEKPETKEALPTACEKCNGPFARYSCADPTACEYCQANPVVCSTCELAQDMYMRVMHLHIDEEGCPKCQIEWAEYNCADPLTCPACKEHPRVCESHQSLLHAQMQLMHLESAES